MPETTEVALLWKSAGEERPGLKRLLVDLWVFAKADVMAVHAELPTESVAMLYTAKGVKEPTVESPWKYYDLRWSTEGFEGVGYDEDEETLEIEKGVVEMEMAGKGVGNGMDTWVTRRARQEGMALSMLACFSRRFLFAFEKRGVAGVRALLWFTCLRIRTRNRRCSLVTASWRYCGLLCEKSLETFLDGAGVYLQLSGTSSRCLILRSRGSTITDEIKVLVWT